MHYSLLWNRLTFTFGILFIASIVYLALLFPRPKDINIKTHLIIWIPIGLLAIATTFSGLVVQDITIESWGTDVVPGPLFSLFTPIVLLYAIWSLIILWTKYLRSNGRERQQILYVTLGLLSFLIAGTYTQLISFYLVGDYRFAKYGPYSAYFLSFITAYAIIAHRLFDIRILIKRTVIFTGLSAFVLTMYSAVAFLASGFLGLGAGQILSAETLVPGLIGGLIIALGFNPLYKWLSEVTDSWLFKGEYRQEDVLRDLSQTLANVIDLEEAIKGMMEVVVRELRLEKAAVFMLHGKQQGDGEHEHELKGVVKVGVFSQKSLQLSPRDSLIEYFEERGIEHGQSMLAEDLERIVEAAVNDERKRMGIALLSRLKGLGAAVAIPLIINRQITLQTKPGEPTKTQQVRTLIGILVLGPKKSGDVYSDQDLRTLEIVASETAAAVEKSRFFEEDRLKSEFVSIASHELLTPTTAMKGYLSMVLDEGMGKVDKTAREQLEKVYKESERLGKLVRDLLNVSRIERNKIIIEAKPTEPLPLLEQAVDAMKFKAEERQLTLKLVKPKKKPPLVMVDPEKLLETFINLIGNGLKYTKQGGVVVSVEGGKDAVSFHIKDTGIGISTKDQQHLFTKFFRASNVDETGQSGTGLGLYVSKHVIELMGGTVSLESELGKGSTFTVTVPVAK